jgi:hypothetical protein
MSVKVTDNTRQVQNSIVQKASIFLRFAADEVVEAGRKITPASARNPRLRNDVLKQVLGTRAIIKWNKAYAAYQERGMRLDGSHKVRNYTTPGTGAHFAERSVKETIKRTQMIARRAGLI